MGEEVIRRWDDEKVCRSGGTDGSEQRDETIREYSEALLAFQGGQTKEIAVSWIRWMLDEKAEEEEKVRLREQIRREDKE